MHKLDINTSDKIITVAYGDGTIRDKISVYYQIIADKNKRSLFYEYRKVKNAVKNLKDISTSDLLEEKVYSKIGMNKKSSISVIQEVFMLFLEKPIIPSTAVLLISASLIWSVFFKSQDSINTKKIAYTSQEIKIADKQAKYALAVIGNILNETSSQITSEVLTKEVSEPINQGMTIINNILN